MYGIANYFYNFIFRQRTPSEISEDAIQELEEELRAIEEDDIQNNEIITEEASIDDGSKNEIDESKPYIKEPNDERKANLDCLPEICQHRSGTITKLLPEYGIIDEKYHFDFKGLTVRGNLSEGLQVNYVLFRNSEEEEWRVHKILCIVDELWDEKEKELKSEIIKKSGAIERKIIGQVVNRKERNVFMKPDVKFCLDDVQSDFVPRIGDWIAVHALVELDENVQDFVGDVLSVREITPLRSKIISGFVTSWDSNKKEGVIDSSVWFTKDECEPGYIPIVDDSVALEAIESNQGTCSWRALSVVCHTRIKRENCTAPGETFVEPKIKGRDPDNSVISRHGIQVPKHVDFGMLVLGETKEKDIEISNLGGAPHYLLRGKFHGKKSESQMLLLSDVNSEVIVFGGQKISCRFRVCAKFIGHATEIFVFTFKGFKITCLLHVNVQDKTISDLIKVEREFGAKNARSSAVSITRSRVFDDQARSYMPGVRPVKPPAFIPVRFSQFQVPREIWKIVLGEECDDNNLSAQSKIILKVQQSLPVLSADLTPLNYCSRFHLLLHLEEIEATIQLNKFDMKGVVLNFAGTEFLSLEVAGLSEKRPSLMIGDKVVARSSAQPGTEYEGFVHKVCAQEVWLKFHKKFHTSYSGEECYIHFVLSRSSIRRCHVAIDLALKNLGEHFLFPKSVCLKEPQILLFDELSRGGNNQIVFPQLKSDEGNNGVNSSQKGPFRSKLKFKNGVPQYSASGKQYLPVGKPPRVLKEPVNLKWINSSLNYHQKEAVRNALKGEARPLPYVIFGPPGTGKTITLVEAILQIYKLLPDSRILVATPSNSSANLIAERLLLSKMLCPGDLVRLIAYHCIEDGTIPDILLPYCTTCDISARASNDSNPITLKLKLSSNAEVLGRHRITVGTCIALGQLYTMGFPSGHFTHVCIDEAGQATEPEILIPLGFLHKDWGHAVLAGDPLQLGPVVTSRLSLHFGLGYSYLARLLDRFPYQRDPCGFANVGGYNPKLVTRLVMNYRSLPEILTLPSSLFYDSQLQSQISYEGLEGTLLNSLAAYLPKRNTPHPPSIVFHGVRGINYQESDCPSWFNPQELMQIIYYLKDFFDTGLNPCDIGVITPYQKQVQKLRSLLTQLQLQAPKIGSVEEFQGQERLVIILSAVRSTVKFVQTDIKHALGFVASPPRLNVALTRARALLVIIGNPHILARDPFWRKTLAYCVENDSYVGCDLPRDFLDMKWETSNTSENFITPNKVNIPTHVNASVDTNLEK